MDLFAAPPPEPPAVESDSPQKPTVREIYERHFPLIKGLVLEDQAYQNACKNSDQENARLEGNEAVKRVIRLVENEDFLRLYYDDAAFHDRLHQEIVDETYQTLSQPQQEHENAAEGGGLDGTEQTQALETSAQELKTVVTTPNYEATVTAEEAPLLKRLMANAGIDPAQFVHENGDVTFSFAASERGTVERLITNLRAELSKAVSATIVRDGEDVTLTFDQDGRAVEPVPDVPTTPGVSETEPVVSRDPLAPAYQVGDTVYLDDKPFTITEVGQSNVQLQDPSQRYPIFRAENKENFARLLLQDHRNSNITDFLSAQLQEVNDDLRDALVGDGGLLELRDKGVIAGYIQAGEGNLKIAQRLADTYAGVAETMTLLTGEQADYFADKSGFEVHIHDKYDTKVSMTWNLIAPVLRALYQQELDGLLHKQPTVGWFRAEHAKPSTPDATEIGDKNNCRFFCVL